MGDDDEDPPPLPTHSSLAATAEDDESSDHGSPEAYSASRPWDTRGETGLYGGGGRGADDKETGWVSNYALGSPDARGPEEDLTYEEEHRRTDRVGSKDTFRTATSGLRKSSSGTTQSSLGPVTPKSSTFTGRDVPHIYYGAMTPAATPERHEVKLERYEQKSVPQVTRLPISPPISPKIDGERLRKKPSTIQKAAPQISAPIMTAVNPDPSAMAAPPMARRKSAFSKWTSKSKKTPKISAPILPDGFVESLGMETIALTPGVKLPIRHLINGSPTIEQHSASDPGRHSPAPSIKQSKRGKKEREKEKEEQARVADVQKEKVARAAKVPARSQFGLTSLKLGAPDLNVPIQHPDGTSSLPRPHEKSMTTPTRALDALRQAQSSSGSGAGPGRTSSTYSSEVSDAFRRLSHESDASYAASANTFASAEKTRRLYFNGIREELARNSDQEVQANRAPAVTNAPSVPPLPSRYVEEEHSTPLSQSTAKATTPPAISGQGGSQDGFRNPWGGGGGSDHSSLNATPVHRSSFDRKQSVATINASRHNPYNSVYSAADTRSSMASSHSPAPPEEHRGSTSSAYSEYSNLDQYYSPAPEEEQRLHSTQPLQFNRGPAARKDLAPNQNRPESAAGSIVWGSKENSKPSVVGQPVLGGGEPLGGSMFRNPFG